MVLAAAKDLAALKDRNVNVVFVLFDEEEKGLIGSDRFAKMLKDQKVPVTSVHTVDQMGWDADGDRAIELELPDGKLAELYETAARESGLNVPLEVTRTDTSDHQSFRKYGFQAVGLTEEYVNGDTTPYYHTPRDTYATVNWDYLTSSTRLFDAVLEKLVKPAAPPPPPPEEPDLDDWYRTGCD
jgi:Zn-dependent M28 family amino/carboxypeptidase